LPVVTTTPCAECRRPVADGKSFCGACGHRVGDPSLTDSRRTERRRIDAELAREMRVVWSALAFFLLLLAPSLIASQVAEESITAFAVGDCALIALTLGWVMLSRGGPPLGLAAPPRRHVWYGLAVALTPLTLLIALGTTWLLSQLVGLDDMRYSDAFDEAGLGWPWVVLSIAVVPALFEELSFRGLMQPLLGGVFSRRNAWIVTAVLFAVAHLSIGGFPWLVAMGLYLGWMRERSGSLYPGMLAHFLHNLTVVVIEAAGG
jgi:membrane protease YdiL (CAAX protease family)